MKGPSVPVWCGVCTVPATLCKGWGEPAPAPLKALWDYRPISLFHALLTILFPSSMLPTLFFSAIYWKIRNTRGKCLLTKSFSNVHYIAAILLLTMLAFLFICTVLVSVNAIASRTVLRVISIEFLIHSSHKCYSPNIHFVRFHLKGPFMYLFVFCFCSVDRKRYFPCFWTVIL